MKILVVGAGGVGGFLAGKMVQAGLDVTLLVRERRKAQLAQNGLVLTGGQEGYACRPRALTRDDTGETFDLIVLAMKAYGLEQALADIRPFVGEDTALLPFLNGYRHMDRIAEAYPAQPLLGGVARIEATLDAEGKVVLLGSYYSFNFGLFQGMEDAAYARLSAVLKGSGALNAHPDIRNDLWEKYLFLSVFSGLTTLFQAPTGDIRNTTGGLDTFRRVFEEVAGIIQLAGGRLPDGIVDTMMKRVEKLSHSSTSSMLRDMQQGLPTEGAHIQGYLLELARRFDFPVPTLEVIHQRLMVYETALARG